MILVGTKSAIQVWYPHLFLLLSGQVLLGQVDLSAQKRPAIQPKKPVRLFVNARVLVDNCRVVQGGSGLRVKQCDAVTHARQLPATERCVYATQCALPHMGWEAPLQTKCIRACSAMWDDILWSFKEYLDVQSPGLLIHGRGCNVGVKEDLTRRRVSSFTMHTKGEVLLLAYLMQRISLDARAREG